MTAAYLEASHRTGAGHDLFYRHWPSNEARFQMLLLHGFNDHGGRYAGIAEELVQLGISVTAPDLPGHGRSAGRRGHIPDIHACLSELERLHSMHVPSGAPALLYGHSYGALLAIRWLETRPHPFAKAILESPYLKDGFPVPAYKLAVGRQLARVWPSFAFKVSIPLESLCGHAPVVQAYKKDPLVHHKITAATYLEILRHQSAALDEAPAVDIPVLMFSGSQDKIVDTELNGAWFRKLSTVKTSVNITDGRHECHNEKDHKQLLNAVAKFLD